MYNFFKNLDEQQSCQSSGICTTDLRLTSLEELLFNEIRQISYYLVKAKEHGLESPNIADYALRALSVSLLNTNFSETDYMEVYNKLFDAKEKAHDEMQTNINKSEIFVDMPIGTRVNTSIVNMIREGERIFQARQKSVIGEKKGLFALITILCTVVGRTIGRIKDFEPDFNQFDQEVLRFFSLTASPTTREEKLVRRIKEFVGLTSSIFAKYFNCAVEHYGEPSSASLRTSVKKGKAILVDGLDFKELEMILDTIGDRDINVYTHNILFVAHYFPKFREHKNLVGQWGSPNIEYDFSTFPGAVFLGKSFYQKIDSICRGVLYSTALINLKGAARIKNNDFEPLVQAALRQGGFLQDEPDVFEDLKYNLGEVENTVKTTSAKHITVLIGQHEGKSESELFGNSQIININSHLETQMFETICRGAEERGLSVRFFFAQCTAQVVTISLALKHNHPALEIFIAKCPSLLVNPRVIKTLEDHFDLKIL